MNPILEKIAGAVRKHVGAEIPMSDKPMPFWMVYVIVPRIVGLVVVPGQKEEKVKTASGRWNLGKIPAASALHAINLVFPAVKKIRPAILDAEGKPLRTCKLKLRELRAEVCERDTPVDAGSSEEQQ